MNGDAKIAAAHQIATAVDRNAAVRYSITVKGVGMRSTITVSLPAKVKKELDRLSDVEGLPL
jgi:hypothetical protein